jgi:hypothetical protein
MEAATLMLEFQWEPSLAFSSTMVATMMLIPWTTSYNPEDSWLPQGIGTYIQGYMLVV